MDRKLGRGAGNCGAGTVRLLQLPRGMGWATCPPRQRGSARC